MNKKKIKILIVLVILALIVGFYLKARKRSIDDIQRDVNIVELERNAKLDSPPESDDYGHEIGNGVYINLSNRQEFLEKVKDLDYGLSIVNALNEGFPYINIISETDKDSIKDYYNKNSEVIDILYGIKDYDTFLNLYNDLGNDKKINCTILLDSVIEENNIYRFDIELVGNEKVVIPVKVLAKKDDDMIGRMYFYGN